MSAHKAAVESKQQKLNAVQSAVIVESNTHKVIDVAKRNKGLGINVYESASFLDALVLGDSYGAMALEPNTGFVLIDSEAQKTANNELDKIISEGEVVSCDPGCWRGCLQMKATKEVVFSCINTCGCGYESPNLLLLAPNAFDPIEKPGISLLFIS